MTKAIVLLSGGLDSVVSIAKVRAQYEIALAITFNYGQKAFEQELNSSKKIAEYYNIEHIVIDLPWLNEVSNSCLNQGRDILEFSFDMEKNSNELNSVSKSTIVPNRNALFINIAASIAEAKNYKYIILGANEEESHNYKDNSNDFIDAVNLSLKNSTENEIQVLAPLIKYSKQQIVEMAIKYEVPLKLIHSCYNNQEKHCGYCESCLRLKRALQLNNREDIIRDIF